MLYMLSVQFLHQRQGTASKNKGISIPLSFLFHEQTISGRKRGCMLGEMDGRSLVCVMSVPEWLDGCEGGYCTCMKVDMEA